MSKSNPCKADRRNRFRAFTPKVFVSVSLLLSLVLTAVAVANWGGSNATTQGDKKKTGGEMSLQNLTVVPSKEYVYVGGRPMINLKDQTRK